MVQIIIKVDNHFSLTNVKVKRSVNFSANFFELKKFKKRVHFRGKMRYGSLLNFIGKGLGLLQVNSPKSSEIISSKRILRKYEVKS